jgi:hypothetical protein
MCTNYNENPNISTNANGEMEKSAPDGDDHGEQTVNTSFRPK